MRSSRDWQSARPDQKRRVRSRCVLFLPLAGLPSRSARSVDADQLDGLFTLAQVISTMHQRFPDLFTPPFSALLLTGLKPTSSSAADKDIREKEDNTRIIKQRGLLRVVGELEAVGIVRKDGGKGVTGELTWGALKDLVGPLSSSTLDSKADPPRVDSSLPTKNPSHSSPLSPLPSLSTSAPSTSLPSPPPLPSSLQRTTSPLSPNPHSQNPRTRSFRGSRRRSSGSCSWRTLRR